MGSTNAITLGVLVKSSSKIDTMRRHKILGVHSNETYEPLITDDKNFSDTTMKIPTALQDLANSNGKRNKSMYMIILCR